MSLITEKEGLPEVRQLGTRAEAQQRVLADGVTRYSSWRDVDARIKEVEKDVIRERKELAKAEDIS
jgi:hypothetical protein